MRDSSEFLNDDLVLIGPSFFPRIISAHPEDVIIGKKNDPIITRSTLKINKESLFGLVSMIEPTSVDEALKITIGL